MRRCQGAGLTALAALLLAGMARAQIQQEPFLQTTESTGINITCSHQQIQIGDWIQWYRLLAGRAPELLALTMKETKELPGSAGQLLVSADRRSSALWLAGPRRGDAAVYYCVLGATARGAGAAAGHEPPRAGPAGASRGRCRSARRAAFAPLGPGCRGSAGTGTDTGAGNGTMNDSDPGTETSTVIDTGIDTDTLTCSDSGNYTLESPTSLSPSSQHLLFELLFELPDPPSTNPIQFQSLGSL